jgi:hypothetical protein
VLQLKDLRRQAVGEKVTVSDGKSLEELEGLPGGKTWVAGTPLGQGCGLQAESGANYNKDYT